MGVNSVKDAVKAMRRLERELRVWCARPANRAQRDAALADMGKYEKRGDLVRAAICLDQQTIWDARTATLAILEGDGGGWGLLDRVLQYRWLHYRISAVGEFASRAALILAHAVVLEEDEKAHWLAQRIMAAASSSEYDLIGWDLTSLPRLCVWAWSSLKQREVALNDRFCENEIYARIFRSWHDVAELESAVLEACDRHLEDALEAVAGRGYPDFGDSPYDLMPVELLALFRVRRVRGLPAIQVDHPLLATPLARVPARSVRPAPQKDPVFESLLAKAVTVGAISET